MVLVTLVDEMNTVKVVNYSETINVKKGYFILNFPKVKTDIDV